MIISGEAAWRLSEPGRILITSGDTTTPVEVDPPAGRPTGLLLAKTGWLSYPGSEWHEVRPGEMTVAVFAWQ